MPCPISKGIWRYIIAIIVIALIVFMGISINCLVNHSKCSCFSNENQKLINQLLEDSFMNRDQIEVNDSYENKHLFEQQVFKMLNPNNQSKYLNLSDAEKDIFLFDASISNINKV